ncbi:MAG: sulfatase, partial [Gemmatimonadaceae bacterium]
MILLALALGVLSAAFELGYWAIQSTLLHHFIFAGADVVWQTILGDLLGFGCAGVVLAALLSRVPRGRRPSIALLLFLCCFSIAFLFHPALNFLAGGLLSIGVAWQISGFVDRQFVLVERWARWVTLTGIVAMVVGVAGVRVSRLTAEHRGETARAAEGPNIVLLILDTVRASELSLYGYDRRTSPVLDSVAAVGVTFDAAISASPWTLPSHAAMFTGRSPYQLLANWDGPLEDTVPTLAEVLLANGYRTGGFAGNVAYVSRETGLDRGFAHFEDYTLHWSDPINAISLGRFVTNNPKLRQLVGYHDVLGRRTVGDLNSAAMSWLDRASTPARPFFLMINYYDAHEPFLPHAPFDTRFGSTKGRNLGAIRQINTRLAERSGKMGMDSVQRDFERLAYDQSIAELDAGIGHLLDSLRARGLMDRTVLAIVSDHGEQFGEHGLYSHGNSLYLPALHVPLVIVAPGVPRGERRAHVVSTQNLGATLLSIAGAKQLSRFPGRSFFDSVAVSPSSGAVASIRPARNQAPEYPSYLGPMYSVTTDSLHVIDAPTGEEIFRWRALPESTQGPVAGDSIALSSGALRSLLLDARRQERLPEKPPTQGGAKP